MLTLTRDGAGAQLVWRRADSTGQCERLAAMSAASRHDPPKRVVCHVIEGLDYGGGEILVHSLAAGAQNSGYRAIVCSLQPGPLAQRLDRDGIALHCLHLRRRSVLEGPLFVVFVLKLLWHLVRLIRSKRIAIVHAHLQDSIIWSAFAGVLTGTPVVGTYHGLGVMPKGRSRWDPRNAVRRGLYRLAGRLTARTIAVSNPVRRLLCDDLGFDDRKTVLLQNGVDTSRFEHVDDCGRARTELGLENRAVVVCVGRLIAAKGQRFLVDAMVDIVRRHPAAALLLVGDGPERAALEEHVGSLNLAHCVRWAAKRNDVPELLAMAAVFVLPSFSEGIPLALVEAMAAGRPVVATAVPGNVDVVVDDRFGVLVPPRDAQALADGVCGLLDDPVRAAAIAARGRERVREHFDSRRSLAATVALYDEVLAERGRLPGRAR